MGFPGTWNLEPGTWMTECESVVYRVVPKCACSTIGQIMH